ncbi:MAG TPA: recombination protein RecR [Zetaproteobacteria bacterium]|nr:recombination protein RecR [Zetaproteobacteria bacterium]
MQAPPIILGIMSGTSADGIDVAVMRMTKKTELLHFLSLPMPPELREPILRLAEPGVNEIELMGALHVRLGHAYAHAALQAIEAAGLKTGDIAAIGCHGQTIRHRPGERHPFTMQIGCAATIAERTGITTVDDFRSRDIAAGGQGAPLVPFAHRRLFASEDTDIAVLNIGGIANITWLGRDGSTSGFDCGPGNMLMDVLMLERSGHFSGRYHVLHGRLSPVDGIGPEQLRIKALDKRIAEGVKEMILATSATVDGEATAHFIARRYQAENIRISRIARGVPEGSELEYLDEFTLSRALDQRVIWEQLG